MNRRNVGSVQEFVKVLILGSFLKGTYLVGKVVGKLKSNKDAGKSWGFAVEMWKVAQNAAFHIPTATAAAAA